MPQPSEWLDLWETFATESKPQFILELKATDITICFPLNNTYFTDYFLMQTVWEVALLLCLYFCVFFDNIIMSIVGLLTIKKILIVNFVIINDQLIVNFS